MGVVALIALVAGVLYYYWLNPLPDVRSFTGDLRRVSGNTVTLNGVFYSREGTLPESLSTAREFTFRVDNSTRFWKTVIQKPTPEEVMAMGGRYRISDLPKKEGQGTLQDLAESQKAGRVYVEAEFPSSIVNTYHPVASYVIYRVTLLPAFPPAATTE